MQKTAHSFSRGLLRNEKQGNFMRDQAKDLLSNVLLVLKTPKYERLKDSQLIKHPYI